MASALLEELKAVATEVKQNQIEDAVDSPWAVLATGEDPQKGGIGTELEEEKVAGGGGGGGLNSENIRRIRWQPSLTGRIS